MWGIRDYRPYPVDTVEDLVERHGERLTALVGRRFDGSALQVYNSLNALEFGYEDQHSDSWHRAALSRQVNR
ncbi:hypothetical protein OG792_34270 [Micromonospora sp. NBC_01699]|uniref:hypothetical protein n=1 Tax=Micromonospora sp. NBC_01699 TaxID=2975984 RepID=UPI002E283A23|nr:hypothetical protein [Micromonospora sp. NBC_01699]